MLPIGLCRMAGLTAPTVTAFIMRRSHIIAVNRNRFMQMWTGSCVPGNTQRPEDRIGEGKQTQRKLSDGAAHAAFSWSTENSSADQLM
jgi:hypothetical protein